jgi:hypothetical protein
MILYITILQNDDRPTNQPKNQQTIFQINDTIPLEQEGKGKETAYEVLMQGRV